MNHEDTGWNDSAQAWIANVDGGDIARMHLLDPVMLELCAPRPGLRALDAGCGEGRFCRMLHELSVQVIGLDPTATLIAAARERDPDGDYRIGTAESLPFASESFDIVVSYLTLIDIADFRAAIGEMARVLRPGGKLVVANLTALSTATPHCWWRDENGQKLFWTLDDYMTERPVWVEWNGIRVINWHRPLSAYMQAFLAHELLLEHYEEMLPTPEQIAAAPGLDDHARKPDFVTMRWGKPLPG
ncbi:MAG: class I SAM-dependent methyltransferase [Armatimonadota bacterium]|nr:class I SAM-dependent methyltransferase [Armatimonadota bacterium]